MSLSTSRSSRLFVLPLKQYPTSHFLAAICGLCVTAIILCYGRRSLEFLIYWESARGLVQGDSPYSLPASAVGVEGGVVGNWYPPHIYTVLLPFTIFSFEVAQFIWFCLLLSSLASVALLLRLESTTPVQQNRFRKIFLVLLVGTFFPVVSGLSYGQISQLVVGGLSLFYLRTLISKRDCCDDFLAGCFLSICTLKPHVTYRLLCCSLVALLVTFYRRRW